MDCDFNFEASCVALYYASDAVPQLHCPKTRKPIFPEMTVDGMFVDGVPLPSDTTIDYIEVPSVAFHIQTGVDGQADYFRADVASAIASARSSLAADDDDWDDSDYEDMEILQDHVSSLVFPCLILHVILDNDEPCSTFIGLDLSA